MAELRVLTNKNIDPNKFQNKKLFLINILSAFLIAFIVQSFSESNFLQRIDLLGRDIMVNLKREHTCNPHIVIIEISDEDITRVGMWPWKRIWNAALIKALNGMGAKQIYFDLIFSESHTEEDDDLFSEAIKTAENVYLPFVFTGHPPDIKDTLLPMEKFSSYAKGIAPINIYPDVDGDIRKIPLFFKYESGISYHLALRVAMDYLGLRVKEIRPYYILLSDDRKEEIRIPLIEGDSMLINWAGKWKDTFKHYSFLDVLVAYQDQLENKKPRIDASFFKDSICIVTVTAIGLCDVKSIPIEQLYPGAGVIATTINSVLERKFVTLIPPQIKTALIYILALVVPLLIFSVAEKRRFLLKTLFLFGGVAVFFVSYCFSNKGLIINPALPMLSFVSSYFLSGIISFFYIKAHLLKLANTDGLTGLFNIRYFRTMIKNEYLMAKANSSKNKFCIIMADIDNFKKFNDTYGHDVGDTVLKEISKILRTHLRPKDIVARYGGEEIIMFIRNASLEIGEDVAEGLRKKVETHVIKIGKEFYKATISLGVAALDNNDEDEDSLIKRSDVALYYAKKSGRNCAKCSPLTEPIF